jgi:pimeloyl-ACP methyl ester carboxylesterase
LTPRILIALVFAFPIQGSSHAEGGQNPAPRVGISRSTPPSATVAFKFGGLDTRRPCERGKVPVLLIHGLGVGPDTWWRMLSVLEAEPIISARFRFWTFTYDTGVPIPYSAAMLRRALRQARQSLDPEGSDNSSTG